MAETGAILAWTLINECPVPDDVHELLVEGERAVAAYKAMRDSAIFTNKRLIVRDAQGLRGKLKSIRCRIHPLLCGLRKTAMVFLLSIPKSSFGQERAISKSICIKGLMCASWTN